MAIRWSPGCKCCGSECGEIQTGFTPTSKYTRGSYAEWQPNSVYAPGDTFAHYRNSDGRVCEWIVTSPTQSGSGWTAFEESRYQFVDVIDYIDDVEEWFLYGSGWGEITAEQKERYITNGRLAARMGYVSREPAIASVASFSVQFGFGRKVVAPDFRPPVGSLYKLLVCADVTAEDEIGGHFGINVERVPLSEEPTESGVSITSPIKISIGRANDIATALALDTTWRTEFIWTNVCRKQELADGSYRGFVDFTGRTEISSRTAFAEVAQAFERSNGYTWGVVGSGSIIFDDATVFVDESKLLIHSGSANAFVSTEWNIVDVSTVPLVDLLSSGVSVLNPDPNTEISGRHLGVYVTSGPQPGTDYDIENFTGTVSSLAGSATNTICQNCKPSLPCPCEMESEYPSFAQLSSGVDFMEWQSFGPLVPPFIFIPQGGYGPIENIGFLGYAVTRVGLCEFGFVRMHAFSQTVIRSTRPSFRGRIITYLFEEPSVRLSLYPQMLVEILMRSEVRESTNLYLQNDVSEPIPLPTPAQALALVGGNVIAAAAALRPSSRVAASGLQYIWPIPLEEWSCGQFAVNGEYTSAYNYPNSPANSWLGDTWTVASMA